MNWLVKNASWAWVIPSIALLSAQLCAPLNSFAQDAAAKADVVKGLEKLSQQDVALTGVIEEESETNATSGLGIPVMIKSLGGNQPFYGDVDIWTGKNSEVVMVSKSDLPGVKVYVKGEDQFSLQTSIDEPLATANLPTEIAKLTSWKTLAEAVNNASKVRSSTKGKTTEVRVVLDNSFFPVPSNEKVLNGGQVRIQIQGPNMNASVLELTAIFTLNEKKDITGVQYAVQFNDPMRAMFKGGIAGGGGAIAVRGVPAIPLRPAGVAGQEDKEAKDTKAEGKSDAAKKDAKEDQDPRNVIPPAGGVAVQRNAVIVQGNAGGIAIGGAPGGDDDEEALGKFVSYDFEVIANPSPRVTGFVEEARKLIKSR